MAAGFVPPDKTEQVCFTAGYELKLADGSVWKIEDLKVDQELWAPPQDDPNGPPVKCRISRVFHNDPCPTIIVRFDNGLELQGTANHPFWVPRRGWTAIDDLQIGDACLDETGASPKVVSKELVAEPVPVYNIEVEGAHTYFIGKDGKYVLVHNQCTFSGATPLTDEMFEELVKLKKEGKYRLLLAARPIAGAEAAPRIRHGYLIIQVKDNRGDWKNFLTVSFHPDHWTERSNSWDFPGRIWINDPRDNPENIKKKFTSHVITGDFDVIQNLVSNLPGWTRRNGVAVDVGKEVPIDDKWGYGVEGHRDALANARTYNLTRNNCFNLAQSIVVETNQNLSPEQKEKLRKDMEAARKFATQYNLKRPNIATPDLPDSPGGQRPLTPRSFHVIRDTYQ